MLDGVHPAGRERPAVAHPLDAEGDRLGVVAGSHEVGVERVQPAVARPRSPATVRPLATTPWASTCPPKTRPCGCFWLCPRNSVTSSAKVSGRGTGASPAGPAAVDIGCTLICADPSSSRSRVARRSSEGSRLVGGHRGNDSQATSGPARPGCPVPTRRPVPRGRTPCRRPARSRRRAPAARRPRSSSRAPARRAAAPTAPGPRRGRTAGRPRRAAPRPRRPRRPRSRRRRRAARTTGRARPAAPGSAARAAVVAQGRDQGVARAAQVVPARRGEPGSHPHQLEQHQLLEHRCAEVAGDPGLDQGGEPGAGSADPAGAQAAPVRLRRAADGDRAAGRARRTAAASGRPRGRPRRSSRR